jgi:hypothetical protein
MTVKVAASDGGKAKADPTPSHAAVSNVGDPTPTPTTPVAHATTGSTAPHTKSSSSSGTSSIPPAPCTSSGLSVSAVAAKSSYHVGDQPVLELQVVNTGTKPCVQDLADSQVVLRVYNGESRVWGSHDCKIEPGSDKRTLAPQTSVRVAITWSGLTSSPGCKGTRQRVGAGTYTLYAALSGKTGRATQFTIS